ncbi:MAG: VOC family protein [Nocardioides sp.]
MSRTPTEVTWLSAFLDFATGDYDEGVRFWSRVTGFAVSSSRGADEEFASLIPPDGDEYLRVQRLGTEGSAGGTRIHLDLTVADPEAAAARAAGLGATVLSAHQDYTALTSPGGVVFCFVDHPGSTRPTPVRWRSAPGSDEYRAGVYQVCLDLPGRWYEAESRFWAAVLAGDPDPLASRPEFSWLRMPDQLALDVLLQRLGRADGPVSAHLDLGTNHRAAEADRHRGLGAEVTATGEFWTVMRDPTGLAYCLTDRDPAIGRLTASMRTSP